MITSGTYELFLSKSFAMGNRGSVLPGMDHDQLIKEGSMLAICEGYVVDLSGFEHPGGECCLLASRGKDITRDMQFHSQLAIAKMRAQRVAVYIPKVLKSVSTGRGKNDVFPA